MGPGVLSRARSLLGGLPGVSGVSGVVGVLGVVSAVLAARVLARGIQLTRDGLRLAYAVATLRAYRRCPDCRRWLRGDAGVCWRCGARRGRRRRWPRARRRF